RSHAICGRLGRSRYSGGSPKQRQISRLSGRTHPPESSKVEWRCIQWFKFSIEIADNQPFLLEWRDSQGRIYRAMWVAYATRIELRFAGGLQRRCVRQGCLDVFAKRLAPA
ncbi:unnamed protein product, partial [Rhizoctonia solani]